MHLAVGRREAILNLWNYHYGLSKIRIPPGIRSRVDLFPGSRVHTVGRVMGTHTSLLTHFFVDTLDMPTCCRG